MVPCKTEMNIGHCWQFLVFLFTCLVNASDSSQTTAVLSGASSGFVSGLVLQPFDVIKTRLQETKAGVSRMEILRTVYRDRGILGFWRGVGPSVCGKVPGHAFFFFAANGYVKLVVLAAQNSPVGVRSLLLNENSEELSPFGNWVAGSATGITNGFVTMPLNLVKVRFESSLFKYKSLWGALKEIHRTEGTLGFFKGYPPTALRDATFCGVYFLTYRRIQEALNIRHGRFFHHNIVAGIMAGVLATTLSHPYDLVRSRMQVRPDEFTSVLQTIGKIWKLEGRRTFFNGLVPRVMQASLSSAITWAIYEEFSALASRDNNEIIPECVNE